MNFERIVINITGPDKPGIVAKITSLLSQADARVIDIDQILIHSRLNLVLEVDLNPDSDFQLVKELLFEGKKMGVNVEFEVLGKSSDSDLPKKQKADFAITAIARPITTKFIHGLSQLMANHSCNICRIDKLSDSELSCLDFHFAKSETTNINKFREDLLILGQDLKTDLALQSEDIFRRSKRMVVMDMDSTLIQQEVIEELADFAGIKEEVKKITDLAMEGEIDFKESLDRRVGLLKGLDESVFKEVIKRISYTEGVPFLCEVLRKLGYKLAVISGGFTQVTDHIKEELLLDYAFANTLEVENGKLTGKVVPPIVTAEAKAEILKEISQKEGIDLEQVVAIGDGANDLLMLATAGMGIAFNAKPKVQENAEFRVNQKRLSSILYFLGIREKDAHLVAS